MMTEEHLATILKPAQMRIWREPRYRAHMEAVAMLREAQRLEVAPDCGQEEERRHESPVPSMCAGCLARKIASGESSSSWPVNWQLWPVSKEAFRRAARAYLPQETGGAD